MKLIYYKGKITNFGDELNPYIFNQLLPNMFDGKDDIRFYGIGSMIGDSDCSVGVKAGSLGGWSEKFSAMD